MKKLILLVSTCLLLTFCREIKPNQDSGLPVDKPGNPADDNQTGVSFQCERPETTNKWRPVIHENKNIEYKMESYASLQTRIVSFCGGCHLAPAANKGNFQFLNSYESQVIYTSEGKKEVSGIKKAFPQLLSVLEKGTMPPGVDHSKNAGIAKLLTDLKYWERAGKPEADFPSSAMENGSETMISDGSDLGNCIPKPEVVGSDPVKDQYFENLIDLPKNLKDTDLFSKDSLELAQKGTLSYAVEYPLWADNAEKGRFIHLPTKANGEKVSVFLDSKKNIALLPANTRFYKHFYKAIKDSEGQTYYRIIETRIIVTRKKNEQSLFGTYKWNEEETEALLVDTPYRDGTGFKDDIFQIVIDERSGKKRKYAIPGAQRCVECHKSSENLVLGFTPLQLNRRKLGEGGRTLPTEKHELNQIERLTQYGVLSPLVSPLPKLEMDYGTAPNESALQLQGYLVGNCAHCHSPEGFAMKDNQVKLDLSPGRLFTFDFNSISKSSTRSMPQYLVRPGNVDKSYLYSRISQKGVSAGVGALPMPMHTPGDANCRLLNLAGSWIFASGGLDPASFVQNCETQDDFHWIDLDMTWPSNAEYEPRRPDWNSKSGMPDRFRNLSFDRGLSEISRREVPAGFYETRGKQEICSFPDKSAPRKPLKWMTDDKGKMKRPFGEVYWTTPGAWAYTTTCSKCHGSAVDGKSGLASNLMTLSGGSIRVPSFKDGLFGNQRENQKIFNTSSSEGRRTTSKNLAPNYLIWMAMEGTNVNFPAEFEPYLGKHKAQMLNLVRERCKALIATSPQKLSDRMIDYAVFSEVCFYRNGNKNMSEIQYDPATDQPINPKAQDAWADRAAMNVGFAIFQYLDLSLPNRLKESPNECEKVYPR